MSSRVSIRDEFGEERRVENSRNAGMGKQLYLDARAWW